MTAADHASVEFPRDAPYVHERVVAVINLDGHYYPVERDDAWRIAWSLIEKCVEHEQAQRDREVAA